MERIPEEEFIEAFVARQIGIKKLIQIDRIGLDERRNGFDGFGAVVNSPLLSYIGYSC